MSMDKVRELLSRRLDALVNGQKIDADYIDSLESEVVQRWQRVCDSEEEIGSLQLALNALEAVTPPREDYDDIPF